MRMGWDFSSPTHLIWVAYDCESQSNTVWYCLETGLPTDRDWYIDSLILCLLRPCFVCECDVNRTWRVLLSDSARLRPSFAETQATHDSRWDSNAIIIARSWWGNCDLLQTYSRPQKFMSFFRVESVDLLLLFLFGLFYVIYHRPSVELQCNHIFLYIIHDSLVSVVY